MTSPKDSKFFKENLLEFRFCALAKKEFDEQEVNDLTVDRLDQVLGRKRVRSDLPVSIGIKYSTYPDQTFHEMSCALG